MAGDGLGFLVWFQSLFQEKKGSDDAGHADNTQNNADKSKREFLKKRIPLEDARLPAHRICQHTAQNGIQKPSLKAVTSSHCSISI